MKGQWLGTYEDSSSGGLIHVNIDELTSYFQGWVYIFPNNNILPPVAVSFKTPNKSKDFSFRTSPDISN
jgi:hypothetical protein